MDEFYSRATLTHVDEERRKEKEQRRLEEERKAAGMDGKEPKEAGGGKDRGRRFVRGDFLSFAKGGGAGRDSGACSCCFVSFVLFVVFFSLFCVVLGCVLRTYPWLLVFWTYIYFFLPRDVGFWVCGVLLCARCPRYCFCPVVSN